ncbi:hypothetical protein [Atlantibacter hermannii]|uniref:Uncharacterized protein n=1 Tax=Atlantibacter hermannii NBRC 105704 TaxID=1115512 RepID=H5UWJ3_ATLHE|nr:hypothetical protein [Atlantibacter hermannii]QPS90211.1 hypothetical protein I6G45_11610 [Atlantibacter hermannii]GAB50274.1 hypothetical protein EH105704_01_02810 [Atlantibacter hermannii NBRC 105704]VDZ72952.1 CPS-53 (KpLE1) prophage protein [Atlantibacter hermannii]
MKLHEMDGFLKGKCLPGDMLVNENNAEYLVRKFAELQSALDVQTARSEALAAENAALIESHKYVGLSPKYNEPAMMEMKKPFIDELIHRSEYYSVCGHISAATNRAIKAVHGDYSWLPETPATDAWVNEQRAVGVELFAAHLRTNDNERSPAKLLALGAEEFAAQLRGSESVPVERLLLNKLQEGRS